MEIVLIIVLLLFGIMVGAVAYWLHWLKKNIQQYTRIEMENKTTIEYSGGENGKYIFTETNESGSTTVAVAIRMNCCNGNVYSLRLMRYENFAIYVRIKNHDIAGEILTDCVCALNDIDFPDVAPQIPVWFSHNDCRPDNYAEWYEQTKTLFNRPNDYRYLISSMMPKGIEQPDENEIMRRENRRLPLNASESVMGFVEQIIQYAVVEQENSDEQIRLLRNNLIEIAHQYCDVNDLPSTRDKFLSHVTFIKHD